MANRRMFSLDVVDTDKFLDMPATSQNLYFHLGMRADDDGVVDNPRKITKIVNCSEDDLSILAAKGYVIQFDDGILVLTHWKINNLIQKDRYKRSLYQKTLAMLTVNNGMYEFTMDTECIQDVSKMETQYSVVKDNIVKDSVSCAEVKSLPHAPTAPTTVIITLKLNDAREFEVTDADLETWKEIYPAVDVMGELRKMRGWLEANPKKRKTAKGVKNFINNWLSREQDKGKILVEGVTNNENPSELSVRLW